MAVGTIKFGAVVMAVSLAACKTTGGAGSDANGSSVVAAQSEAVDPLAPCGAEVIVNPIDFANIAEAGGMKFATAVSFAAPKELLIDTDQPAQSPETWILLMPKKPDDEESIFSIRPSVNISFIGRPNIGQAYPVVDDCFEPREGNSPLTVCGDQAIQEGTVTYLEFPDPKVGGNVVVVFDLKDEAGVQLRGKASSCLTRASLNPDTISSN